MPKTTNLNLNLTTDASTLFKDWRDSIDGNNSSPNYSNMQIIDEAVGKTKPITMYNNITVYFVADATYNDYGYRGTITINGIKSNDIAEVTFDLNEATSGNYAPICQTTANTIYVYSKVGDTIVIPLIKVYSSWQ